MEQVNLNLNRQKSEQNNSRYIYLALSKLKTSEIKALNEIKETYGGFSHLLGLSVEKICSDTGLKKKIAENILTILEDFDKKGEEEESKLKDIGADFITIADEEYPPLLSELIDPPIVLYIKGKLPDISSPRIAVVGSRNADSYGLEAAYRISKGLAQEGCSVISGMARGIDGASHSGCLAGNGKTVAVLGCGIDVVYPPEHASLAKKICNNGAIITEYPLGTTPFKSNFPKRNRIIAGMSLGVLVVQADIRSGSLSTASQALEYGREVMAVPGSIFNQLSIGTHGLLKDGAHPVENALDVLRFLNLKESQQNKKEEKTNLEGQLKLIYDATDGFKTTSQIAEELSLPAGALLAGLSHLEAEGYIKKCNNGIFIKLIN